MACILRTPAELATLRIAELSAAERPNHPDAHYLTASPLHTITERHRERVVKYINEVRPPPRAHTGAA